jgi:hypothetical protein
MARDRRGRFRALLGDAGKHCKRRRELELKPRIIAKMLFFCIPGEGVAYGQIEAIAPVSHGRFSCKRLGSLATAVILGEASELSVLPAHTITRDP